MTYCGIDFHARQQHIALMEAENGEIKVVKLEHKDPERVRKFYAQLPRPVVVGLEAGGYSAWFEEMLFELGHEVRIGNAYEIRKRARSRQKNDRRDAELILDLLLKDEFPQIHRPTPESRAIIQRLRHRRRLVRMRVTVCNHLHVICLSMGVSLKGRILTRSGRMRLEQLPLTPVLTRQREQWLGQLDSLTDQIKQAEVELKQLAEKDRLVKLVSTHPGIGYLTGLALVHTLIPVTRFANSRKVTAYAGLDPVENSSGDRRRIGSISKRGSRLLRFQLVEAAGVAVKYDDDLRRVYHRLTHRRDKARAKVAVARRLLIRAFILLRDEIDFAEFQRRAVAVGSARK
jgi:transposase